MIYIVHIGLTTYPFDEPKSAVWAWEFWLDASPTQRVWLEVITEE